MDAFERIVEETVRSGIAPCGQRYEGIFDGYSELPFAFRSSAYPFTTASGVIENALEKAEGTETGARLSMRGIVRAMRLVTELSSKKSNVRMIVVRVTGSMLDGEDLFSALVAAMEEEGFEETDKVCLEFPVSILEKEKSALKRAISEIKAAGFKVAVSPIKKDFAFAALTEIKFDYVFLSPELTALAEDRSNVGVLAAIIALLHTMGVGVIAEGVMSDDVIRELTAVECAGLIPSEGFNGEFVLPTGITDEKYVLSFEEEE